MELFRKDEDRTAREAKERERREALQHRQQDRRAPVEQESKRLIARQRQARSDFAIHQKVERAALRQGYLQESKRIRIDRAAHRPQGLAAFIGRITGVELITKKIHEYRDKTRYAAHLTRKRGLTDRQQHEAAALERRQALETLTMQRRLRAIELVEQRELRSLENALLKDRRIEDRERLGRQPPPVEPSRDPHLDVFNKAAKKPIDLMAEFQRAAQSGEGDGKASGESAQNPAPEAEVTLQRRKRTKDRSQEAERSAGTRNPDRDSDNDGPSGDDPAPRRRRTRDFDRDR
jgi:hypothetical protein